MDLSNIVCVCKKKFNKTEFKKHHKNCKAFKKKFYDFDLRIGKLLKDYLLEKENSSIIKFLFQRYIKLIEHKFKTSEIENILRIKKKRKSYFLPSVLEKKTEIQFNLGIKNKNVYQALYGNNDEINDDEFSNRLSFKGYEQNNSQSNIFQQINNINRYQQNNNINRYQQNNNMNRYQQNNNMNRYQQNNNMNRYQQNNNINNSSFTQIQPNYNNMFKSSLIPYNNLYNIQYQQFNNFGQDIGRSNSFHIQNSNSFDLGYSCNNDIYSMISKKNNNNIGNQKMLKIGDEFKEDESKIIINFCKDELKKYGGKFNPKMIETIGKHINKVFSEHKWFILIYNNEYNEIQYNFSQTIPERYLIFSLGKFNFQFKEYI